MILITALFGNAQRRQEARVIRKTRTRLLSMEDRLLEDAGFSRALLEQGTKAWPWRHNAQEQQNPAPAASASSAANDLRSFQTKI